jgi:hypothetical protein
VLGPVASGYWLGVTGSGSGVGGAGIVGSVMDNSVDGAVIGAVGRLALISLPLSVGCGADWPVPVDWLMPAGLPVAADGPEPCPLPVPVACAVGVTPSGGDAGDAETGRDGGAAGDVGLTTRPGHAGG